MFNCRGSEYSKQQNSTEERDSNGYQGLGNLETAYKYRYITKIANYSVIKS